MRVRQSTSLDSGHPSLYLHVLLSPVPYHQLTGISDTDISAAEPFGPPDGNNPYCPYGH